MYVEIFLLPNIGLKIHYHLGPTINFEVVFDFAFKF